MPTQSLSRYEVGIYEDSDGRQRWAVFETTTYVWYFPARYGKKAADQLCRKLNRENQPNQYEEN